MTLPNLSLYLEATLQYESLYMHIDNHGSGYLGMAGCFSVQGKKWSKLTHFQPILSWFQTVSGSNQLYQPLLQSSLSQNIKLQRKPFSKRLKKCTVTASYRTFSD